MAKFIKVKVHTPRGEKISWKLFIDNESDLIAYHNLDTELTGGNFLSLEMGNDGYYKDPHKNGIGDTRTRALHAMMNAKIRSIPEDKKFNPLEEVAAIQDSRTTGMLKTIKRFGAIIIHQEGGYCDLKGYLETWKAEIIDEITKSDFGYPVDKEVLIANTLILENAPKSTAGYLNEKKAAIEIANAGEIKTIYNLKTIDAAYVAKCIAQCTNVVAHTTLGDEKQLDSFMELFSKLPHKNIYLHLQYITEMERLKAHPLFETCQAIHSITIK